MRKQNIFRCLTLLSASILISTGLTAQEKSDSLSVAAVSAVSGDELYHIQTPNLSNTWVGMLPGLTVLQGNGAVGYDNAQWIIRGVGSYGSGTWNSAKIFVDGFEVNSEYLVSLSPSEIESVEILKDGAALAIYGDRGANGVIKIETKRGKIGPATVSAKVRYGATTPNVINKPLGSYHFANLYNQAVSNDNGMVWSPAYSADQLAAYASGTGVDVDQIVCGSAEVTYNLPHWRIGLEYNYTAAWYGDLNKANGKIVNTHSVDNHRIVASATFSF